MRFLIRVFGNLLGLWLAIILIPTITVKQGNETWESWAYMALIALILTIVNSLIRPIVRVVAFPLYIVTFGLFALITNVIVLSIAGWVATSFGLTITFSSFWTVFFSATLIAFVSSLIVGAVGRTK